MGNGEFWYGGIKKCLLQSLSNAPTDDIVKLNFNMDGLPINNSSKAEFWPILMTIAGKPKISPMVVAIYSGTCKPPSAEIFLKSFANELLELMCTCIHINDKNIKVLLNAFICDRPALAFIKCMTIKYCFVKCQNYNFYIYM